MSRMLLLGMILAALIAAALRFPELGARPMHNDEGVNAIKLRTLWEHGSYKYDPSEYHGPTLPFLSWAWMKIAGPKHFVDFDEAGLRMVTVIFGLGLVMLLPLVADGLGRRGTFCAALLTAISPAMVFYSRYYIHEMLLVFFTFLTMASGWRYVRSGKSGWALLTGTALGLMQATKETFVLALTAMVCAVVANIFWTQTSKEKQIEQPLKFNVRHLGLATLAWIVVVVVLFSSFFTNSSGLLDSVRTYLPWLHRAGGASPHIHPWDFYLERLAWFHSGQGPVWSEGLILALALIGLIAAFRHDEALEGDVRFVRFVAIYTVILTIGYSAISYKTPWCLLSFWQGMILLAGVGTATLFHWLQRRRPLQFAAAFILLAFAGQLACQAWRANVDYAANPRNPYVYAQTSLDALDMVERVNALGQVSPAKNAMLIKVMAPDNDYGPLPWYFRRFEQVGWYSALPADPYAAVMLVSTQFNTPLDEKKTHTMIGLFKLRPGNWFEMYVETNLWNSYLKSRNAIQDHSKPGMTSVGSSGGQ